MSNSSKKRVKQVISVAIKAILIAILGSLGFHVVPDSVVDGEILPQHNKEQQDDRGTSLSK